MKSKVPKQEPCGTLKENMIMLFMVKRDLFVAPIKIKQLYLLLVLVVLPIIQQEELIKWHSSGRPQEPDLELSG